MVLFFERYKCTVFGIHLNLYLCTTNERAADDGFVKPGILGFTLAINPLPDEPSSQRPMRSVGPSMPEKDSAYGVFLNGGHETGNCIGDRCCRAGGKIGQQLTENFADLLLERRYHLP